MSTARTFFQAVGLFVVICLVCSSSYAESEPTQSVKINGIELHYISEGHGPAIVFVHGAFSDHRVWEPQREVVAAHARFVAPTMRYFGTAPWVDSGEKYSAKTHTEDLIAFIRALDVGRVYLVGRSYGGTIALRAALQHPELVKGVVAQEPTIAAGAVTDPQTQQLLKKERSGLAASKQAVKRGDLDTATRLFADWTNDNSGGFDAISNQLRSVHLQNGRTIPLHFAAPRGPKISCADLGTIRSPVVITTGELTRPFFRILAEAAHRCIPGSDLVTIAGARHAATSQNPDSFNAVLLGFLTE